MPIDVALTQLEDLFSARYPLTPIPTEAPELPWLDQLTAPLNDVIWQLHEACWLRYVHQLHRQVAATLQAEGRPHLPYIRTIPWKETTALLDTFFDEAIVARKEALAWCFDQVTASHLAELQRALLPLHTNHDLAAQRQTALLATIEALVELRIVPADLHQVPMPFTMQEAMQGWALGKPVAHQGAVNLSKHVRIGGTPYYMKTYDEEASGLLSPAQDQRNEAAITAALNALGWLIGPTAAYHIIGGDGSHYAILSQVPGRVIVTPHIAAQKVQEIAVQQVMLAEYVLCLNDRHHRNVRVDPAQQRLREIDFAGALRSAESDQFLGIEDEGSLGIHYLSHARAIWEAHPATRYAADGSPLFTRTTIASLLSQETAVFTALRRYAHEDELHLVVHRFGKLARALSTQVGDISLTEIEAA